MELISKTELLDWFLPYMERGESIPASVVIADIASSKVIDTTRLYHEAYGQGKFEALMELTNNGNVDYVPVVRCEKCLFRGAQIGNEVWCNAHTAVFRADGFCDCGRPKGGENDEH